MLFRSVDGGGRVVKLLYVLFRMVGGVLGITVMWHSDAFMDVWGECCGDMGALLFRMDGWLFIIYIIYIIADG